MYTLSQAVELTLTKTPKKRKKEEKKAITQLLITETDRCILCLVEHTLSSAPQPPLAPEFSKVTNLY